MSARQDKYIAQLLRAGANRVRELYLENRRDRDVTVNYLGHPARHGDTSAAQRAFDAARGTYLRELAEARNLLHFEWSDDDVFSVDDYGDFASERERERVTQRIDQGLLGAYVCTVYVRDNDGAWDVVDSLGGIWLDHDTLADDRRDSEGHLCFDVAVARALYRHRARDDFGGFARTWVPGHWSVE